MPGITEQLGRVTYALLRGGNGLAPSEQGNDMTNLNDIRELATDELNGVSGGALSDLGQKLQLQLQEANNIFARAGKAQSDISAKWSQTLDGIAQNFK